MGIPQNAVQRRTHAKPLPRSSSFFFRSIRLSFGFLFGSLVEEADDLARDVLAAGLLVVHDTSRGGEDDVAELTGREELDNPLLKLREADVVAGRDDTALVQAAQTVSKRTSKSQPRIINSPAVELDNDLAGAVVVDLLELANVA